MHGWQHKWTTADLLGFVHAGVDILVVAYLIYHLIMLAKGTRAWQIISGLLIFVLILWFSDWAHLTALNWLLKQMFLLGPVAIVILFYPELRHALEEVGRVGFWGKNFVGLEKEDVSVMVAELVRAASFLSDKKIGALVVLERETGLTEIIGTGTLMNAVISAELLETIFYPGCPLHDGAAIVRRDRIVAAGCTLPLSDNRDIGAMVHTRHKAALGMSEQSDALVLVVSEETGIISVAFEGKMVRGLRDDALRDRLMQGVMGRERPVSRRRRAKARAAVKATVSPFTSLAPFLNVSRGAQKQPAPSPPPGTDGPGTPPSA
ncbi:MAG: diadenylate cyclase CdaA [Capsulimonas sp.]|uniref:diadenylate cyclase CdaA n=1 Tax=Capsulimonas sp. TaxID=2494211 RepID=UPI00326556D9